MVYRFKYHRILDLQTFRTFLAKGLLKADDIVTISNTDGHDHATAHFHTREDVRRYFRPYADYKVSLGIRARQLVT